jgi:hypothetical protein
LARPIKEGADYFSHDTDACSDEKIEAMRALYGNDGYAFYFILLERIYKTNTGEFDASKPAILAMLIKKIGVEGKKFNEMLETSFELELFSKEKYQNSKIITSNGIEKRFKKIRELRERWRKQKENEENMEVFLEENPVENTKNIKVFHKENPEKTPERKGKEMEGNDIKEIERKEVLSCQKPSVSDVCISPKTDNVEQKEELSNNDKEQKEEIPLFVEEEESKDDIPPQKIKVVSNRKNGKIPYLAIVDGFNSTCIDLCKVINITPERQKVMDARWKENKERQSVEWFLELFKVIHASDFLNGRSEAGTWQATFDWIFGKKNMIKIQEGQYKNKFKKSVFQKAAEKGIVAIRKDMKKIFDWDIPKEETNLDEKIIDAKGYEVIDNGR